jgi:uncharacterized RDD family membrane protein YckC
MSAMPGGPQPDRFIYDPQTDPALFEGILSKRIVAFCVDAVLVVCLLIPAAIIVFVLGFVTLGLGWLLFPPLFAIVALVYIVLTLGGPASATPGMRITGVEMRTWSGARMFPVLAVMHALVFWVSITVFTPLILLVALFTRRKQLLHDLLLGVVAVNSAALRQRERT